MSCTRRSFLTMAGALAAPLSCSAVGRAPGDEPYADKGLADKWITQWMQIPHASSKPLHLGRFADRMYFLRDEVDWTPEAGQKPISVNVPVGFVTDFASIPRVFWSLLPPDGLYTYPAIIHDYLYWEQPVIQDDADLVLKYAMEYFKVPWLTSTAVYEGVRAGGKAAWNDNARRKRSGEKRILKKTPTDPRTQWSEWKERPDVF